MPNLGWPLGQGAASWSCRRSGIQARRARERAVESSDPNGTGGTAIAAVPQFYWCPDRPGGGLLLPSYPAAIADNWCEGTMGAASRPSPGLAASPLFDWTMGRRGEGTFCMVMRFGHGGPGCCYFYPFCGYAQVLRCRIELWCEVFVGFLVTS